MPFQALPIALRKNTGSPVSKLLFVYLVNKTAIVRHPDEQESAVSIGWRGAGASIRIMDVDFEGAATFCQTSIAAICQALEDLGRQGLINAEGPWTTRPPYPVQPPADLTDKWEFLSVNLPLSSLDPAHRKRIKATPDQIDLLGSRDGYVCSCCGQNDDEIEGAWQVDHIIPQSVGGADVEENCQLICSKCNSRKGAKIHWVDFLGGRR
jgi:hypothetical protein